MSKGIGILTAIGFAFAVLPGPAAAHQHDAATRTPGAQLAEGTKPAAACLAQRQACISAGTQTGANGVRFVPPEVVGQCYDAYRACTKQR